MWNLCYRLLVVTADSIPTFLVEWSTVIKQNGWLLAVIPLTRIGSTSLSAMIQNKHDAVQQPQSKMAALDWRWQTQRVRIKEHETIGAFLIVARFDGDWLVVSGRSATEKGARRPDMRSEVPVKGPSHGGSTSYQLYDSHGQLDAIFVAKLGL